MNTLNAKVRVVRCPRCSNLLPELPSFTVYKCGGCGAVLQAKNQNIDDNGIRFGSNNKSSAQVSELDQVSGDKEPRISVHESQILPSSGEFFSDKKNAGNQNKYVEYPGFSNQVCSPIEFLHHQNEETSKKSISSDIVISSPDEQLEQPQKSIRHAFEHGSSIDNFENNEFVNTGSELRGTRLNMSRSFTTESSVAYYGSVSSPDGMDDDPVPDSDGRMHSFKNVHKVSSGDKRSKRERIRVKNNTTARDPALQNQDFMPGRNSWSSSNATGHYTMERSRMDQDDLLPSKKHPPMPPLYGGSASRGYEKSSSSSLVFDKFPDPSLHSFDNFVDPEQDKMKLIRLVYELQDQLKRSCNLNKRVPTEFIGKCCTPMCDPCHCNHEAPCEELCRSKNYRRPQRHKVSRTPFSGEETTSRLDIDKSCLYCCHSAHTCSNFYSSCPSSPPLLYEVKKYDKKHHLVKKRHIRPRVGGAPFVSCYKCSKLLQLPADFIVFKRRCHRLRCSACSEILEFSLQTTTHLVPYTPDGIDPLPSEVIDRSNLASSSYAGHCLNVDRASCSDACQLSNVSSGSLDPRLEFLCKQSQNRYEDMSKAEQLSPKKVELPQTLSSPLHRLMGYSSPNEMIDRSGTTGKKNA